MFSAALAWAPAVKRPVIAASAPSPIISRGTPELSNSIIASRDTNISPKEIYDFLWDKRSEIGPGPILKQTSRGQGCCLDLGAGAGVSTRTLWEMGWANVVAVDPSRLAWDRYAVSSALPSSVTFFHASDEAFLRMRSRARLDASNSGGAGGEDASSAALPAFDALRSSFDLVVVNYAINHDKAVAFAKELLVPGGRLLAPTNVQDNYWFDQQYEFMDDGGKVLWTKGRLWSCGDASLNARLYCLLHCLPTLMIPMRMSTHLMLQRSATPTAVADDVLFQPDFTSPNCQGQWCPGTRNDDASKDLVL